MCLRFQGSVYFVLHTHTICIPPKDTPQIEKKKSTCNMKFSHPPLLDKLPPPPPTILRFPFLRYTHAFAIILILQVDYCLELVT